MTVVDEKAVWRMHHRTVSVDGTPRTVRFVRFPTGWLVSADTDEGPTLGADRSPYLAAYRALEPLGLELVEALSVVGPLTRA